MLRFKKPPEVSTPEAKIGKRHLQTKTPLNEGNMGKELTLGRRIVECLKTTALIILLSTSSFALSGVCTLGGAKLYWNHFKDEAKNLQRKKDGLAILISYGTTGWGDAVLAPIGKALIPEYVARMELAFDQKADRVIKGATSNDLFEVLADDSIQNVVIYGHGSWTSWDATDKKVSLRTFLVRRKKIGKKKGLFVRHTCGFDRLYERPTFDGNLISQKLGGIRRKLNERLREKRIGDFYIQVSFGITAHGIDNRRDGSAQAYIVAFTVTKNGKKRYGSGSLGVYKAEQELSGAKTTIESLQSANFGLPRLFPRHPLEVGHLYKKEELEEIAKFIDLVHYTVEKNKVKNPKIQVTLGEDIFDLEKIIIVEGMNSPWQWMSEPFGPENTHLDKYGK
jgi:hypothetical protein